MGEIASQSNQATDGKELLAERAYTALIVALRSGALRSGQFLSIPQMVAQLDMPIAAVRDAVKHASAMGLVETFPKRGVQVMEARPDVVRECLDFRMILDQEGARRRIGSNDKLDLEPLRKAHEQIRDLAQQGYSDENLPVRAIATDLSLHDYLADGLTNGLAAQAYAINRIRIAIIQNARPFLVDRIVSAMNEHLAIIDALAIRDETAALKSISLHYEMTRRWWGVA